MSKRTWLLLLWLIIAIAFFAIIICASPLWLASFGDQVVIPASFWSAICFILYYTVLAPWWRTSLGRMVVSLDFAVMLTLLGPELRIQFGVDFSSSTVIRLTVAGLLIVAITILTRIVILGKLHNWWPKFSWPKRETRPGQREVNFIEAGTDNQ